MSKRVLIADDEESIVASLEFLMRRCDYETRIARDGAAAMACLPEFRPDLVLLDLMLPLRSGLEVCEAIRADPALAGTRVLMLTALGMAPEAARASAADDFMLKPFSTQELVSRVKGLLE